MAHSIDSNDFEEIKTLTIAFLRYVAIYSLFDAVQIVFVSAIKGAGDTRFVVIATGVSSTLFLVVGIYGSRMFEQSQDQVNWWWVCLTGWGLLVEFDLSDSIPSGQVEKHDGRRTFVDDMNPVF